MIKLSLKWNASKQPAAPLLATGDIEEVGERRDSHYEDSPWQNWEDVFLRNFQCPWCSLFPQNCGYEWMSARNECPKLQNYV